MQKYAVYLVLLFMFGFFFYSFYEKNLDGVVFNQPATFYVDIHNFKTDKEVYVIGETVKIFTSYCVNRPFQSKTSWRLVNASSTAQISFIDKDTQMVVGCVSNRWVTIGVIPPLTPHDTWRLEGASVFRFDQQSLPLLFKTKNFKI